MAVRTIRSLYVTLAVALLAIALAAPSARAALAPGDIAIIGMNTDNPDTLAFVALVNLPAGEEIRFTDSGWLAANAFRANEGGIKYTVPAGGVAAGTVVSVEFTYASSVYTFTPAENWVGDDGAGVGTGGRQLATNGDQILAYQGDPASPTFLFALNVEGAEGIWQADATSANTSALPQGLTNGTNCVAVVEARNVRYKLTALRSGAAADVLAAISDKANWEGGASRYTDFGTFNLGGAADDPNIETPALVQFGSIPAANTVTAELVITNGGAAQNLDILGATLGGANPGKFSVLTAPLPTGIAPGTSTALLLQFNPAGDTGIFNATLSLQSNDPSNGTVTVALNGAGAPPESPLVISQILYDAASPETAWEFIEIYNDSSETVSLAGYVVDDNNATAHTAANIAGGSVGPFNVAYLYNADAISSAEFRAAWGAVNAVAVTGWANLQLNNTGDRIGLWRSFAEYSGDHANHLLAIVDVQYTNAAPWPVNNAAGAIYLNTLAGDPTAGASWSIAIEDDLGTQTATGGVIRKSEVTTGATPNSGADLASIREMTAASSVWMLLE